MKLNKHDFLVIGAAVVAIAGLYRLDVTKQILTGETKFLGIF